MAVKKLSAIASGTAPATTDQVVGVQGGTTDVLFTFAQIATSVLNPGGDLFLQRDAAGIFALSNGAADTGTVTSPASIRLYNVASGGLNTNYERMEVGFAAHSNVAAIDVAAGGTGTVRNFGLYVGGTNTLLSTSNVFQIQVTTQIVNGGSLQIISNNGVIAFGASLDTIISRPAAATLQFGAADVASPVAQTLSVQNVVGGTSNAAGANWTNIASLATGSGTPADWIVKTGFQGVSSTGTATFTNSSANIGYVNSFAAGQAVQFTSSGTLPTNFALLTTYYVIATGLSGSNIQVSATQGGSAITAGSAGSGVQTLVTATIQQGAVTAMTIKGGTQNVFFTGTAFGTNVIAAEGAVNVGYASVSTTRVLIDGSTNSNGNGLVLASSTSLLWQSGGGAQFNGAYDTVLSRDAAGIPYIASAKNTGTVTNASSLRVYNIASSALANYERGVFGWTDTSNVLTIGTQLFGSGVARPIQIVTGGTLAAQFTALQSTVLGNAALSASANDGFLYIPTCAGTPTGTPTSFTGRIAMVYDTNNHQFWFYDSGWKQPKTPAGAATVTWQ